MASMTAALRSTIQDELLASLFSGAPPDPSTIMTKLESAVIAQGYTLVESALSSWGRKLELELGALCGGLDRALGKLPGISDEVSDVALMAISGIMTLRGQGEGPTSWKLWLDQDFAFDLAEGVAKKALAGTPVAGIVGTVRTLLQDAASSAAEEVELVDDEAWADVEPEEEEPFYSGTGSFGSVAFVVSSEKIMTWREASREHKGRFALHEPLGATPRLEFLSADISETSFSVRLDYALGASPAEDALALVDMLKTGRAELLILGGLNLGPHVLVNVREAWKHTGPGGVVMVADLELSFKEYT